MRATRAFGKWIAAAALVACFFVCIDLEQGGPVKADAFELQFDPKTNSLSEKYSIKNQIADPSGWLTLKVDGTVWNMDAPGVATSHDPEMFNSMSLTAEPAPLAWNQASGEKSTLADTRATLGLWNDRVRFTSREAVSSYIAPGTAAA
ncbi:MAG: hypothetical protein J2P54_03130, partial [Bradyrhizobiaceae bacterium]|nr:hypothetical protein [Bradyrhizobiaceae bacterium]